MRNPLKRGTSAGAVEPTAERKATKVINPLNDKPLPKESAAYVLQCRESIAAARKDARSGNPAKRAAGLLVLRTAPRLIHAVYAKEARR